MSATCTCTAYTTQFLIVLANKPNIFLKFVTTVSDVVVYRLHDLKDILRIQLIIYYKCSKKLSFCAQLSFVPTKQINNFLRFVYSRLWFRPFSSGWSHGCHTVRLSYVHGTLLCHSYFNSWCAALHIAILISIHGVLLCT